MIVPDLETARWFVEQHGATPDLLAIKRGGTEQGPVADVAPNADALSAFVAEERRRHF